MITSIGMNPYKNVKFGMAARVTVKNEDEHILPKIETAFESSGGKFEIIGKDSTRDGNSKYLLFIRADGTHNRNLCSCNKERLKDETLLTKRENALGDESAALSCFTDVFGKGIEKTEPDFNGEYPFIKMQRERLALEKNLDESFSQAFPQKPEE